MLNVEPRYSTIPTGRYTQTSPCCNLVRSYDSRLGARPAVCSTTVKMPTSAGFTLWPSPTAQGGRVSSTSTAVWSGCPRIANPPYCAVPMRTDRHSTISPARKRSSPPRHLPTPGLPQKSKCPCAREVLRIGASRGPTRSPTWRSASCATSQHSPRATGRPDAAERSANAATAAPCVSAARRNAAPDMGSGHGRKRAQRVTLPFPYDTEYQHMLRSEKRTTPRASKWPKEPAKRISGDPFMCGGIGGSPVYQSVSQGVAGCMNTARSAAAEPFAVGGGNDIWRSTT